MSTQFPRLKAVKATRVAFPLGAHFDNLSEGSRTEFPQSREVL